MHPDHLAEGFCERLGGGRRAEDLACLGHELVIDHQGRLARRQRVYLLLLSAVDPTRRSSTFEQEILDRGARLVYGATQTRGHPWQHCCARVAFNWSPS